MTERTREEKNRILAEWLNIGHPHTVAHDEQQAEQSDPYTLCGVQRHAHARGIPDFYTSEEANALVLDKLIAELPVPSLEMLFDNIVHRRRAGEQRRVFVCEAAIAWIDKEKQ